MPELPKKLQEWLKQPGSVLTQADRDFVQDADLYARLGVGYGFMQQVTEWLWQEWADKVNLPGSAWGPEFFNAKIAELTAERDKLLAFKTYVHKRLDDAGVSVDPESSHKAEGCRIGGRLDEVFARVAELEAALKPFADYAVALDDMGNVPDDRKIGLYFPPHLTAGDCRTALRAGDLNPVEAT